MLKRTSAAASWSSPDVLIRCYPCLFSSICNLICMLPLYFMARRMAPRVRALHASPLSSAAVASAGWPMPVAAAQCCLRRGFAVKQHTEDVLDAEEQSRAKLHPKKGVMSSSPDAVPSMPTDRSSQSHSELPSSHEFDHLDLDDYPADEDPSITAARIMAREDVKREREQRQGNQRLLIIGTSFTLAFSYHIYRCRRDNLPIFQTWLTLGPPPVSKAPLPNPHPYAEDGAVWTALRQEMPFLKPNPQLQEEWKRDAEIKKVAQEARRKGS
jgi:hypothetical protein